MSSTDSPSCQLNYLSRGEMRAERPARRTQRDRTHASARASEKYPLFEVDWWRIGGYVAGAVVVGGLYLYGIGTVTALVTYSLALDDLAAILIVLGGVGSLLGLLWSLVRWPRVLMYEAVTVIVLQLTASRFLPAYTSLDVQTLVGGSLLYLPLVVGGGIGMYYRRYRARRPSDRSRRDRPRR